MTTLVMNCCSHPGHVGQQEPVLASTRRKTAALSDLTDIRRASAPLPLHPDRPIIPALIGLTRKSRAAIDINAMSTALRFFFKVTLDQPEVLKGLRILPLPDRLPVVLMNH